MDITKMLAELRHQQHLLGKVILNLEKLALDRGKGRGRGPEGMTKLNRRGRPPGSKNKNKPESYSLQ